MKKEITGLDQADIIYFAITDRFARDGQGEQWLNEKNLRSYQGGNLAGIRKNIPYLKHLGITALWITPVYLGIGSLCSATGILDNYHGYWPLDFERVDPRLLAEQSADGRVELKNLVDDLHENGIKLILDMVVSHTGYQNEFYHHYAGCKLPPHWFKPACAEAVPHGLPSLNHRLPDVCDYFVNNIIDWIEDTGIDAIRLDSARHIDREFWSYFKSYVRGKYRQVFFLGEVLDFDEESVAAYQREFDFDSLFDFPLCGNMVDVLLRNEDYKPIPERRGMMALAGPPPGTGPVMTGVLDTDWKYNNANRLVTLVDNHDLEKRSMSWALKYTGGDRLQAAQLVNYVLTCQFTLRGIPQVYYGAEIGLEGERQEGGDQYLRRPMPWRKIDPRTLEPYRKHRAENKIYSHLRRLIKLRRESSALTYGHYFTLYSSFDHFAFLREFRGETFIIVMNNRRDPTGYDLILNIAANPLIPTRIKENILSRQIFINVFEQEERITCSEDGKIICRVTSKEAKVFELA